MQLNIKKISFILLGLAVIVSVFFFSKNGMVHASKKDGEKFEDWIVSCVKKDEKSSSQSCFLVQQLDMEKDGKKNTIAVYQFGYVGEKNSLVMIQTVPLMVNLENGTNLIADKNPLIQGKYQFCGSNGCQAVSKISSSDLQKLLSSKELSVSIVDVSGQTISLPMSSNGLKKGLEYIK